MRCTKLWRAMATIAAVAFASRLDAQTPLGLGDAEGAFALSEVASNEIFFEISDVVYEESAGGWVKFAQIPFGPSTEFENGIPQGTVISVHETIHISPDGPAIWDWHQELFPDSVDYASGDETFFENTVEWVQGSVSATFNGNDVLADVGYENVTGDEPFSIVWMDFTQGLRGGTLEIWKEYITTADVPLYHPDDTEQTEPGGDSYAFIYQFPTVPEPATSTIALLGSLLVVSGARHRLR